MSKRRSRGGTRVIPTPAVASAKGRGANGRVRLGPRRRAERTVAGLRDFALRHQVASALVIFGAVAALTRPATWYTPLFEDPAQYLYVAQTILDGGAPYADAANNKGPLTYLLFAFFSLISGTSVIILRLTLLVFTAVAALFVAGYVSRYAGRATGFLAGVVFAVFSSTFDLLGYEPNTEGYGVAPMAAAWYFAARGGTRSAAGAGACCAVATLMNPAFGIVVPIAALELWRRGRENGTLVRLFGWATAAGTAVTAVVFVWLGLAGAVDDMFTQVLGHVTHTVGSETAFGSSQGFSPGTSTEFYRYTSVPAGSLWIAAVVGSLVALRSPRLRPLAVPTLLWLALSYTRVKIAEYELFHQYYIAMPGIAVGIAIGIASLWGPTVRSRVAIAALVLAVPVATLVVGPQWAALQLSASARFGPNNRYQLAEPVADFIRANTRSDETIMVGGHNAQVYWLADRRAPTRFFDLFSLGMDADYPAEYARALRSNPPRAIVVMPDTGPNETLRALITDLKYQLAFEERGALVWLRF